MANKIKKSCEQFQSNKRYLFVLLILLMFLFSACNGQLTVPVSPSPDFTLTSLDSATLSVTLTKKPSRTPTQEPTETIVPSETIPPSKTPKPTRTFTPDLSATLTFTATNTLAPTNTKIPSRTPFPTRTLRPSRTPTLTETPTPPLAFFRINNIRPFSFVTSPIRPEAIVSPGEDGFIIVELIGEDGRTITKENINYKGYMGRRFGIAPEVNFELQRASEYGRLLIYTEDRYNRTIALTSVDLILLQLGSNKTSPPNDLTEPFIIRKPRADTTIEGGFIVVEGLARILSTNPILIECIDPDGNIVGDAQIELEAPNQVLSHIPFEAFIPYSVDESTNVRITVRQDSDSRLPGTLYLFSFEVTLEP